MKRIRKAKILSQRAKNFLQFNKASAKDFQQSIRYIEAKLMYYIFSQISIV